MRLLFKLLVSVTIITIIAWPIKNILSINFVDGHDFTFHIVRILALEQQINQGNYFPRWLPDAMNGYGVPLFNFVWGLPYYLAVLLIKLGFDYPVMHKIWFAIPILLAGFSSYLWARTRSNPIIAAVASVVYVWTPFFFLGLFKRNTIGEVYFLALLPLIFYWVENAKRRYAVPVGALTLAALIYSHNALAMFAMAVLLGYIGFQQITTPDRQRFIAQIRIILLGILQLAFFIIPALAYQGILHNANITHVDFPPLQSLIRSRWEGGSVFEGQTFTISFQIGLGHLALVAATSVLLGTSLLNNKSLKTKLKPILDLKSVNRSQLGFWLTIYLISLFLLTKFSEPLWYIIPLIINIQFPFRLLFLLMFVTTSIIPFLLTPLKPRFQYLAGGIIIVTILFFNRNHLAVLNNSGTINDYRSYHSTLDGTGEFLPAYFNFDQYEQARLQNLLPPKIELIGEGQIISSNHQPYQDTVTLTAPAQSRLYLRRLDFPYWHLRLDSQPYSDYERGNGIIVTIPPGSHTLTYTYQLPLLVIIANTISQATFVILSIWIMKTALKL